MSKINKVKIKSKNYDVYLYQNNNYHFYFKYCYKFKKCQKDIVENHSKTQVLAKNQN